MHVPISPAILYWGTPVVLITTQNPPAPCTTVDSPLPISSVPQQDDLPSATQVLQLPAETNIAPMSSAWWLGHRCVLGLAASSATTINLLRTKQCVLNLPSDRMGPAVNALARTTGTPEVPLLKQALGYSYCADKFGIAGLTPLPSEIVNCPRIKECPVQMEAELVVAHEIMSDDPLRKGVLLAIEVRIVRVWVEESMRKNGFPNRIDSDRWRPLIMSFQQLYGLSGEKVDGGSRLAAIDEENYRVVTGTTMRSNGLQADDTKGQGIHAENNVEHESKETHR